MSLLADVAGNLPSDWVIGIFLPLIILCFGFLFAASVILLATVLAAHRGKKYENEDSD
jgi:hypothetical protein